MLHSFDDTSEVDLQGGFVSGSGFDGLGLSGRESMSMWEGTAAVAAEERSGGLHEWMTESLSNAAPSRDDGGRSITVLQDASGVNWYGSGRRKRSQPSASMAQVPYQYRIAM
jgi:hypothetical protein